MMSGELVSSSKSTKGLLLWLGILAFALLGIVAKFGTPYMCVATFSYFTMVTGLVLRNNKKVHYKLMATAITLDLLLVLVLEVQRHAIHTALSFTLSPLQQAHIGASSVATALYLPVVILGLRRLWGLSSEKLKTWHMKLGITAFIFRSLGFLLMFSLIGRHHR
jgi:hypothetical protein